MFDKPRVVGHRGWPTRFPDNTLAGFLAAASVADAVETDIRRSGDGKLVLSHDPTIGGLVVAVTPWRELDELDLGEGHHPTLLDEAMSALPDTPMQLEIKNLPFQPGFEPDHRLALETAERARPADLITSFSWPTVDAVKRVFPEARTGICVTGDGDLADAVRHCFDVGHRAVVASIDLPITAMAAAVEQGIEVYPWVVGQQGPVDELAAIGVSGMITDDPDVIRSMLRRKR